MNAALCLLVATLFAATTPPVPERLEARSLPSVFMAWSNIDPLPGDELEAAAKHDLIFHGPEWFGVAFDKPSNVLWTGFKPESLAAAQARVGRLRALNPNAILLVELRYRDAPTSAMPKEHPWWMRDDGGELIMGWEEGGYPRLDTANPELHAHVARQAEAVMATGLFDGVMLDWWIDDEPDRLALATAIRERVPAETLILVNANDRPIVETAALVNGSFMECWQSADWDNWEQIEASLVHNEASLREPRINALSTWFETGRDELDRMRATTALGLTRSDGFVLFCDPGPLPEPDHRHDWYAAWDVDLGQPTAEGFEADDGTVRRPFERGWAIYNRPGNDEATIELDRPHRSVRTGEVARRHRVPAADGDLLVAEPAPRAAPAEENR